MYAAAETHHLKDHGGSAVYATYMQPPKLEDFFADGDSTETQESSLTHIYDHHHHNTGGGATYFGGGEHQDLNAISAFQAFSANSGSEVDDPAFGGQTQSPVESGSELVPYTQCPTTTTNALSLGVNDSNTLRAENGNKNSGAVARVDSESCKKVAETFGQRTSIYRGVTRYSNFNNS